MAAQRRDLGRAGKGYGVCGGGSAGARDGSAAGGRRQWRECSDAMHSLLWAAVTAALLALAAARTDQDFEFDDDSVSLSPGLLPFCGVTSYADIAGRWLSDFINDLFNIENGHLEPPTPAFRAPTTIPKCFTHSDNA